MKYIILLFAMFSTLQAQGQWQVTFYPRVDVLGDDQEVLDIGYGNTEIVNYTSNTPYSFGQGIPGDPYFDAAIRDKRFTGRLYTKEIRSTFADPDTFIVRLEFSKNPSVESVHGIEMDWTTNSWNFSTHDITLVKPNGTEICDGEAEINIETKRLCTLSPDSEEIAAGQMYFYVIIRLQAAEPEPPTEELNAALTINNPTLAVGDVITGEFIVTNNTLSTNDFHLYASVSNDPNPNQNRQFLPAYGLTCSIKGTPIPNCRWTMEVAQEDTVKFSLGTSHIWSAGDIVGDKKDVSLFLNYDWGNAFAHEVVTLTKARYPHLTTPSGEVFTGDFSLLYNGTTSDNIWAIQMLVCDIKQYPDCRLPVTGFDQIDRPVYPPDLQQIENGSVAIDGNNFVNGGEYIARICWKLNYPDERRCSDAITFTYFKEETQYVSDPYFPLDGEEVILNNDALMVRENPFEEVVLVYEVSPQTGKRSTTAIRTVFPEGEKTKRILDFGFQPDKTYFYQYCQSYVKYQNGRIDDGDCGKPIKIKTLPASSETFTLSGCVTNNSSQPIINLPIILTKDQTRMPNPYSIWLFEKTKNSGCYQFTNLPQGLYEIRLGSSLFSVPISKVDKISLTQNQTLPTLKATRTGFGIRGSVKNLDGSPLNATINIQCGTRNLNIQTQGIYDTQWSGISLPAGTCVVTATKTNKTNEVIPAVGSNLVNLTNNDGSVEFRATTFLAITQVTATATMLKDNQVEIKWAGDTNKTYEVWSSTDNENFSLIRKVEGNSFTTTVYGKQFFKIADKGIFITETLIIEREIPSGLMISNPYPNPAGKEFTLELVAAEAQEVELKVFNILGQEILSQKEILQDLEKTKININLEAFSAGIYFVRILGKTTTKTLELVKI